VSFVAVILCVASQRVFVVVVVVWVGMTPSRNFRSSVAASALTRHIAGL
jgi:hypothetical protein